MKFTMNNIKPNKRNISGKNNFAFKSAIQFAFLVLLISGVLAGCQKDESVSPDKGYYTCSMHPQVIQQEPGACPICGMNLVFQENASSQQKEDHSGHGINEHKKQEHEGQNGKMDHSEHAGQEKGSTNEKEEDTGIQRFSIKQSILINSNLLTVGVVKRKFVKKSNYSAHIDFNEDPNKLVLISTKYDGWVEKLFVSKEGQWIKKGQRLMGVYAPLILAAKEEYITTYNSVRGLYLAQEKPLDTIQSDPTLKAARRKLRYLDVSSGQIAKLEKAGAAGRLTYYHAPIGGVIVKKEVLQGAYIKPGQEIFRIANMNVLWGFIHIFEKDLPFIKKGQRIKMRSAAYPNMEISGKIDLIYPFLDKTSKDIKVRIVFVNQGRKLRPGMFADVEIMSSLPGKSLLVPDTAIIYSGSKNYVFVSLGGGEFELRPIKVKLTSDNETVISKGLKENEQVVINGQFLLDSEASLKQAVSKGQAGGHQH